MANFTQMSETVKARVNKRAAKFEGKIRKVLERAPLETEVGDSGAQVIIQAAARFLTSFGSEVVRLNRLSTAKLNAQDQEQRNKLRTRAIAEVQAQTRDQLKTAIEQFARGRINAYTLKISMQDILRQQALTAAVIGVSGVGNLTENVLIAIRRQLTEQFRLLDGFIDDVASRQLTNKDRARALQYAGTAHSIAQTANRQMQLDSNQDSELEERRRLGGGEHCEDCVALEAEGWQPAGYLPAIGQGTVCGNSCHCWLQIRLVDPNAVNMTQASIDA